MIKKRLLKFSDGEAHRLKLDHRGIGDKARDRRDWEVAAYAYSQHLAAEPNDGPIWVQHGHMLKEAGLLGPAAESYDCALKLMPWDADIRVQRAILHKFCGEFAAAVALYKEAARLGFADAAFLEDEIGFLSRTEGRNKLSDLLEGYAAPIQIYVSCAAGAPRNETQSDLGAFLGKTNYSYAFIMKGFCQALAALDLEYEVITAPELVANIRNQSPSAVNLHFAFQPPDMPRFLKGAYNIVVMAWEFERLRRPHEIRTNHAFADPALMLRRADEVWMTSEYGAEAMRRSGVTAVHTVPTPMLADLAKSPRRGLPSMKHVFAAATRLETIHWTPLAFVPGLQSSVSQESRRRRTTLRTLLVETFEQMEPIFFVSVLNIYDYRKQIKPVLEAFVRLAKLRPNVFLLLKVSFLHRSLGNLNEFFGRHQIEDPAEMAPPLVSDRIWLTADVLSRDEINHLYDLSAFYVSTSHGEGQNLPLIEAMGRGVVPVSVDHTAMRDYISEDNAIIVRSTNELFNLRLRERYEMQDINTFYVSAPDALNALQRACETDDARYASMSQEAHAEVHEKFGLTPFRTAMEDLFARTCDQADAAGTGS